MADWEASDDETTAASPPPKVAKKPVKTKWDKEEEEEDSPVSDWEQSSDEEEEKPAAAPVAAPKKKGSLKAKLAEIEANKAARAANGEDEEYDSDAVLDPRAKARADKERELNADLDNAAALFGTAALGGTSDKELDSIISADPRTKDDFAKLSTQIIEYITKRHQSKPLYPAFVEMHVRALAEPLKDIEVRKAASGLTTLANEKQKEQRDKASGKKKPKSAGKPGLGVAKTTSKMDTGIYDEALDDFGSNADDFM